MHALTHIRKAIFGMTQKDFAAAVGVNQSTVSRWEAGGGPSLDEMAAIRRLASDRGIAWDDRWFFEPAEASPFRHGAAANECAGPQSDAESVEALRPTGT